MALIGSHAPGATPLSLEDLAGLKIAGVTTQGDLNAVEAALRQLFDDAGSWNEHGTYSPQELAIRLHHRIAAIHPFVNGNGRHARLLADMVLVRHFKARPLPWGGGIANAGATRATYLDAMRAADHNDIQPLLQFALSGPQ